MDEFKRLYAVELFKNLQFDKNEELKNIVNLVAEICDSPVALITLLDADTNWFIAKKGVDAEGMPRETSFCRHTILQDDVYMVSDASNHEDFKQNPLVVNSPNVRFYAGAPLSIHDGSKIGSLCVIDVKPKVLTELQQKTLRILTNQIVCIMELELSQRMLKEQIKKIESRHKLLLSISQVHSHEFRKPVASILGLMNIIREENYVVDKEYLIMMEEAVKELDEKIHLIVEYTQVV